MRGAAPFHWALILTGVVQAGAALAQAAPSPPPVLPPSLPATSSVPAPGAGARVAPALEAPAAPPSRWSADLERIDEDVRLRLLTPGDPRSNFIRAALDKTDVASQVAHFAAARSTAPEDRLYLASLANACLTPTQPVLPDCDSMDRLADWARRDEDNGVPSILLANRARQHGENDSMVAHLAEAAGKPRFDEYWGRGVLAFWDWFRGVPLPFDPAAKAVAALTYATEQPVPWTSAVQALCANPRERANAPLRAACTDLGRSLAARGSTWTSRLIGVTIAYNNAPSAEKARIESSRAEQFRLRARCDDARRGRFDGLESADPAVRTRDLAAVDQWIRAEAQYGEVGACERLVSAAR